MTQQREAAVTKYLDGEKDYGELEEEIGEEAAEAVRESKEQLSQAEDLAGELSKL
jgi:hypothetical protein